MATSLPLFTFKDKEEMLNLFNFKGHEIRFIDGDPVANDVADVLGYADPASTVSKKVKPKYKGVAKMATAGGIQTVIVLKEGGIYQLVIGSKLESAEEFQDWLFEEVLPSIRKTGSYSIKPVELSRKQILEMALESENARIALEAEVKQQKLLIELKDETITAQAETLVKWHPLVENYKQFLDCKGLISMDQAAKMLDTGRVRLYEVLRLYGIILPEKREPYQKYMKHFKVKNKTRKHPNHKGEYEIDVVPLFTPEGLNSVVKILERKAGDRETLMEYLKKPSLITGKETEKKLDACEAIKDVLDLDPEEMTISDHLEASVKLGFHKD